MGAAVMVVRRKNFTKKNGDASLRLLVLRAGVAARLGNRGNLRAPTFSVPRQWRLE